MAPSVPKRSQGSHDRGAAQPADDDSVAEPDSRSAFIGFRFDRLDIFEEHGVPVEVNVGSVRGVLLHSLHEPLTEDLWPDTLGDVPRGRLRPLF
jgi:hypothetical protein